MFSGVPCPSGKSIRLLRARERIDADAGVDLGADAGVPRSPSNSFFPFVPAAISASMPPAEYPAMTIRLA